MFAPLIEFFLFFASRSKISSAKSVERIETGSFMIHFTIRQLSDFQLGFREWPRWINCRCPNRIAHERWSWVGEWYPSSGPRNSFINHTICRKKASEILINGLLRDARRGWKLPGKARGSDSADQGVTHFWWITKSRSEQELNFDSKTILRFNHFSPRHATRVVRNHINGCLIPTAKRLSLLQFTGNLRTVAKRYEQGS